MSQTEWVELPYVVELVGDTDYYLYLDTEHQYTNSKQSLTALPEELSSIGISFRSTDEYFNCTSITNKNLGELFCERIYRILQQHWDFALGLPYIKFYGYVDRIDDMFKQRPVVVYVERPDNKDLPLWWCNHIPFLTRFTFCAEPTGHHFKLLSQDHTFVVNWLTQQRSTKTTPPEKFNITKIHEGWYPVSDFRTELLAGAKSIIDEFMVKKRLNIYVPDFMVVPVYHIRRFQKAQKVLHTKYQPVFVMSLPYKRQNEMYTILFPICRAVTRHNLHVDR